VGKGVDTCDREAVEVNKLCDHKERRIYLRIDSSLRITESFHLNNVIDNNTHYQYICIK
jgi:hypothetical protein